MELKPLNDVAVFLEQVHSNRTIVELKLMPLKMILICGSYSNRTIVELKQRQHNGDEGYKGILIVP